MLRRLSERIGPRDWRFVAAGWLGAVFAIMVARSWLKWSDVLVDFGQQLYVAWRLTEGEVLYRDIAYFHGPLSSYLHAGIARLAGMSLLNIALFNLALVLVFTAILQHLMTRLAGAGAATVASTIFLTLFAFSQYLAIGNYNYVTPYTYEITHGLLLALTMLLLLDLYAVRTRRWQLVAAGLALGLCALAKAEVFVAAAAAASAGILAITTLLEPVRRRRVEIVAVFLGSAIAPPLLATALFSLTTSPGEALHWITSPYRLAAQGQALDLRFYQEKMGLVAPRQELGRMAVVTALWLSICVPAGVVALLPRVSTRGRKLLAVAAFGLVVAVLAARLQSQIWLQLARPVPVATVVLFVIAVRKLLGAARRRDKGDGNGADTERAILQTTFTLLALVLLAKMILSTRIYHYGFALAMPATLLLVLALVAWLPRWIDRRGGAGCVFRAAALGALSVTVVAHVLVSQGNWQRKVFAVGSGADTFYADGRGEVAQRMLAHLREEPSPAGTLLTVPDGIMMNYLSRRRSPVPFLNYVPTEVFAMGEERILTRLRMTPPDRVLLVDKSTAEFGYRTFGIDYGQQLAGWIDGAFVVEVTYGAPPLTDRGFGMSLLRPAANR